MDHQLLDIEAHLILIYFFVGVPLILIEIKVIPSFRATGMSRACFIDHAEFVPRRECFIDHAELVLIASVAVAKENHSDAEFTDGICVDG
jgi:hypothetical protein